MTGKDERINLMDLEEGRMRSFFEWLGEKPFRAQQVLKWIYHQGVTDFDDMTNLSLGLRERLKEIAKVEPTAPSSG